MAHPAAQLRHVEDVDHGAGRISEAQLHVRAPLALHPPRQVGLIGLRDQVVVIEQPYRRRPHPGGRLQHRRAEHLISQRPLPRCGPTGEVARPHLRRYDERVFRPRRRIRRIDGDTDIQAALHPPQPPVLSPPRQLLRCRIGIDLERLGDTLRRYEPAATAENARQLRPARRADPRLCHRHSQTSHLL